jgi:hypothetical protein
MESFITEIILPITYGLILLATACVLLLPVIKSLDDPKSLLGAGVGVAVLAVLFFIGWSLSGDEVTPKYANFNVDAGLSKIIGGWLTMLYLLFGITFVSLIYSEVSRLFK